MLYGLQNQRYALLKRLFAKHLLRVQLRIILKLWMPFQEYSRDKIITEDEDGFLVPSAKCTDLIEYVEKVCHTQ